jgi:hypothetical protein
MTKKRRGILDLVSFRAAKRVQVPNLRAALQQDVGSVDVHFYERAGVEKGAINVGLRQQS